MLESWKRLPQETRARSRFVYGPWNHRSAPAGDLEYPGEAIFAPLLQIDGAINWFDHIVKGKEYAHPVGVMEVYSVGENCWRTWQDQPVPVDTVTYRLSADKALVPIDNQDAEEKICFDYNPADPVPSISYGLWKGSILSPKPAYREDVVSFLTEPLEEPMYLGGSIELSLEVASSAPATAFAVTVFETTEEEESYWITEDITDIRWEGEAGPSVYQPGNRKVLKIRMQDVFWMLKKGSRLRLDVSSSNYPLYHVHPNTEKNWAEKNEPVIAHQTIFCGGEAQSYIRLPLMEKQTDTRLMV